MYQAEMDYDKAREMISAFANSGSTNQTDDAIARYSYTAMINHTVAEYQPDGNHDFDIIQ